MWLQGQAQRTIEILIFIQLAAAVYNALRGQEAVKETEYPKPTTGTVDARMHRSGETARTKVAIVGATQEGIGCKRERRSPQRSQENYCQDLVGGRSPLEMIPYQQTGARRFPSGKLAHL